jgi:hypothetical protein
VAALAAASLTADPRVASIFGGVGGGDSAVASSFAAVAVLVLVAVIVVAVLIVPFVPSITTGPNVCPASVDTQYRFT